MLRLIFLDLQARKAESRRPPPGASGEAGCWVKDPYALHFLQNSCHLRIHQQSGLSTKLDQEKNNTLPKVIQQPEQGGTGRVIRMQAR